MVGVYELTNALSDSTIPTAYALPSSRLRVCNLARYPFLSHGQVKLRTLNLADTFTAGQSDQKPIKKFVENGA